MDDIDYLIWLHLKLTPADKDYAEVRMQIEHALQKRAA
jgi:hypothetical protein